MKLRGNEMKRCRGEQKAIFGVLTAKVGRMKVAVWYRCVRN